MSKYNFTNFYRLSNYKNQTAHFVLATEEAKHNANFFDLVLNANKERDHCFISTLLFDELKLEIGINNFPYGSINIEPEIIVSDITKTYNRNWYHMTDYYRFTDVP